MLLMPDAILVPFRSEVKLPVCAIDWLYSLFLLSTCDFFFRSGAVWLVSFADRLYLLTSNTISFLFALFTFMTVFSWPPWVASVRACGVCTTVRERTLIQSTPVCREHTWEFSLPWLHSFSCCPSAKVSVCLWIEEEGGHRLSRREWVLSEHTCSQLCQSVNELSQLVFRLSTGVWADT